MSLRKMRECHCTAQDWIRVESIVAAEKADHTTPSVLGVIGERIDYSVVMGRPMT
jgi:hypothetical protein